MYLNSLLECMNPREFADNRGHVAMLRGGFVVSLEHPPNDHQFLCEGFDESCIFVLEVSLEDRKEG